MRYKREESFRFQFRKPLQGMIKVIRANGISGDSNIGTIDIMDVSPHGVKFKSSLDLPIHENRYLLEITFELDGKPIHLLGEPVWKKSEGAGFVYGFSGLEDEGTKNEIIGALKDYSKKIYYEMKNGK
ncbi:PilZ domain-containing protein [Bacillus sp. FJAT-29790]|uniref:PilZ domain-containing protein n=1 Tax=Bacillus sp. FJAT-29790 TaxID=1895002 RepID=UPI001C229403|nr:PilZ domain-containing protein [Bacillus sp. FJAT-29790]MBU8877617.1 PilZ domain-containing protein [Bacillus sp. FJAT-29790]